MELLSRLLCTPLLFSFPVLLGCPLFRFLLVPLNIMAVFAFHLALFIQYASFFSWENIHPRESSININASVLLGSAYKSEVLLCILELLQYHHFLLFRGWYWMLSLFIRTLSLVHTLPLRYHISQLGRLAFLSLRVYCVHDICPNFSLALTVPSNL